MNALVGKAERKYLAAHAEPEADFAEGLAAASQHYGHVLVVPASGESLDLDRALASIPEGPLGPVLTILVINASPEAASAIHDANERVLEDFAGKSDSAERLATNANLYPHPRGALLVIDRARYEYRLPAGEGVGLARKIGADLALALIVLGRIGSRWIHVSDADAIFPGDYFRQVLEGEAAGHSARLYGFRHLVGNDTRAYEAALQYEMSLRYYVLGLRFADSPYAFHSIGSTLAIDAVSYAKVRGFPRRTAAEDFYLLNKLAKVGRIDFLAGSPLGLSSRVSHRVPFGTGAAIARMLESHVVERTTYHPAIFHHLRTWLRVLEEAVQLSHTTGNRGFSLTEAVDAYSERDPCVDSETLFSALQKSGELASLEKAFETMVRMTPRRVHELFDGFRTLKLIHALRDLGLPDLTLREALGTAEFLSLSGDAKRLSTGELAGRLEVLDRETCGSRGCA